MPKKITLAQLKAFIRKNKDNLYIKELSRFNGMTDGVEPVEMDWVKVEPDKIDFDDKHTLGIPYAWIVGSSRDFCRITDDGKSIEVYNSCGNWEICIK